MGQHILPGNPPIAVTLRRSSRARRISLRVSGLDGRVTLTLPTRVPEREGLEFVREKRDWLHRQLSAQDPDCRIGLGSEIPVEGRVRQLARGEGRRIVLDEDRLWVPGHEASAGVRVQAWLKARARDRLAAASDQYAAQIGRRYHRLTLRDTRSRWGSCSAASGLMYSWRLVLAPPDVLNYVAAHEVAHLAEMNHSPAFWRVVCGLMPEYEGPRGWLRKNGAGLHRYRFDA